MAIAAQVRASGLPLDKVVVIGSGLLDQLRLRPARDVDLVVEAALFEQLRASGLYMVVEKHGQTCLEKDDYELWQDWGRDAPFERLWREGQELDGVRFVSTDFLMQWKRQRGAAKDLRDVAMLASYNQKMEK